MSASSARPPSRDTIVAPIRRQEPGHYAFYKLSAQGLSAQLAPWQRWLVRRLRTISFAPVGVNNDEQRADFGDLMLALGITDDVEDFAETIARVERELLWARDSGMRVPPYIVAAFRVGGRGRARPASGFALALEHPPRDEGRGRRRSGPACRSAA